MIWFLNDHQFSVIATMYGRSTQYTFPISTILQTTSVYFCVIAAADCFVRVVLSSKTKEAICTPRCSSFPLQLISWKKRFFFYFVTNLISVWSNDRNGRYVSVQWSFMSWISLLTDLNKSVIENETECCWSALICVSMS